MHQHLNLKINWPSAEVEGQNVIAFKDFCRRNILLSLALSQWFCALVTGLVFYFIPYEFGILQLWLQKFWWNSWNLPQLVPSLDTPCPVSQEETTGSSVVASSKLNDLLRRESRVSDILLVQLVMSASAGWSNTTYTDSITTCQYVCFYSILLDGFCFVEYYRTKHLNHPV